MIFFFFFQAEDGIRDADVTGVQTCALPIFAECMAKAGVEAGLPPELAEQLARWTVAGGGELLHHSDLDASLLRQNVTSPNGTTFAALQVLMDPDNGLAKLMQKAVAAAAQRSRELAK